MDIVRRPGLSVETIKRAMLAELGIRRSRAAILGRLKAYRALQQVAATQINPPCALDCPYRRARLELT